MINTAIAKLMITRGAHNEIDENNTKWISENEFKSDKFMMKLMMFLMPGMFKKQSYKFMESFKQFVEQDI